MNDPIISTKIFLPQSWNNNLLFFLRNFENGFAWKILSGLFWILSLGVWPNIEQKTNLSVTLILLVWSLLNTHQLQFCRQGSWIWWEFLIQAWSLSDGFTTVWLRVDSVFDFEYLKLQKKFMYKLCSVYLIFFLCFWIRSL